MLGLGWSRTTLSAKRDVLVTVENGWVTLGIMSTGVEEKMYFSLSKAFC